MFISIFKSEVYHKLKIDPSTSTHEATFTFNYGHSFHLYVIGFVFVELSGILNVCLFSRLQAGHSMISSRNQQQQVSWLNCFWDFPDSHFHSASTRKAESYRNPIPPNFLNYVIYCERLFYASTTVKLMCSVRCTRVWPCFETKWKMRNSSNYVKVGNVDGDPSKITGICQHQQHQIPQSFDRVSHSHINVMSNG